MITDTQYDDRIIGNWLIALATDRTRIADVMAELDDDPCFFEAKIGRTKNGVQCLVLRCSEDDSSHFKQLLYDHGFEAH